MKNELVVAVGAIPVTMFVLSSIGSSTNGLTDGNKQAVKEAMGITSTAMIVAAAATGSVPAAIATGLAIGASFWMMRGIWNVPSLSDAVPL